MWKAAGKPSVKRPNHFTDSAQAKELMDDVHNSNCRKILLLKTVRGRHGCTYAHWQTAIAYAKYLSPAYHKWANEVIKEPNGRRPTGAQEQATFS